MLRSLIRKLMYLTHYRTEGQKREPTSDDDRPAKCSKDLSENLERLKDILGDSGDIIMHEIRFGRNEENKAALVFIDGLVNSDAISQNILRPLLSFPSNAEESKETNPDSLLDEIQRSVLCIGEIDDTDNLSDLSAKCLSGDTALLLNGTDRCLIISTKGWEKRSVTEPQTANVVRGPREGFTENLRTNTALLRRRIKAPELRIESMVIGERTQTNVCIAYMEGIASSKLLRTVRHRLKNLNVDAIIDSGYIEEYIEDAPFSVFATVGYTEKPDVVASRVLEGRVAIIVDGSPFVLTAPMLFVESFQTAEDYYVRSFYATISRILRYLAYFVTIFGPGIFIAVTTFHQELIPFPLLLTIANARENTPFSAAVEALILVFSFEMLRESGLRLPNYIGQAISVVGALIMGDAAVAAGLVGAPMVITIAFTSVAGFVVPEQNEASTVLRIIMLILGSVLGGFGIALGASGMLLHLASLKSFGVPYFEGLSISSDLKDIVVRVPLWSMIKRPKDIAEDPIRARFFIPPSRPHEDEEEFMQEESKP